MRVLFVFLVAFMLMSLETQAATESVRIKELVRIQGVRSYPLVGYGIVVGLAGSGDSDKNKATRQAMVNTLKHFNVNVDDASLSSRNAAAVMVTGNLQAFSESGDQADVEVSSVGDARSLLGGTLIMTPLYGPDEKLYALAQGPISTGGFIFEANENSVQKNHPTVGRIPRGATIERGVVSGGDISSDRLTLILNQADYTTAKRISDAISAELGLSGVKVIHAAKIEVPIPAGSTIPLLVARLEDVTVRPDYKARVVVNERTGTVVAGANVRIAEVNISQGDLNVVISTKYQVSQPTLFGRAGSGISTAVVPDTKLTVTESNKGPVQLQNGATVGDLVQALSRIHLSTRDVITVLQAIKEAGALHADLIIQ